jgi:prephenate dehydratase
MPVDTTTAALDAVREGLAEFACVPIENSIDGSVTQDTQCGYEIGADTLSKMIH